MLKTSLSVLSVLAVGSALAAPPQAAPEAPAAPAAAAQAPAPAPPVSAAPSAPRTFFDGVQLTFEGKAATPGLVGIDVQTAGGEPKVVWVRVLAKTAASRIAEDVAKEITFALGSAYKVKNSGGEVRALKANGKSAAVSLSVAGLSVYGVSVKIEKD